MDLTKTAEALKKRGYEVSCFSTAKEAAEYLNEKIDGKTVGFGDSETLLSMHLFEMLQTHNDVYHPMFPREGKGFYSTARDCLTTEIFVLSATGLAETGDRKVYFVISRNKICPTLEEAAYRARNVAAPMNAQRHKYKTPCAFKMDHCYDCRSPQRICSAQVIYWRKMNHTDMEVVLIDEDMGY